MALGVPPHGLACCTGTAKPANLTGSKIEDDIINDPNRAGQRFLSISTALHLQTREAWPHYNRFRFPVQVVN